MIQYMENIEAVVGDAMPALVKLLGYIRTQYTMDEIWDGKDELKMRRSGKTFVTIYIREGYFTLLLIYGKKERQTFEGIINEFTVEIQNFYQGCKTYHDGKWMFINVYREDQVDELIRMMYIKKKPNRKKEKLDGAVLGRCGHRCDHCLLYEPGTTLEKREQFTESNYRCYNSPGEDKADCSKNICPGCKETCEVTKCNQERGYESCFECDYNNCPDCPHFFIIPGRCNVGISNDDVERAILPYMAKQRFDLMKEEG